MYNQYEYSYVSGHQDFPDTSLTPSTQEIAKDPEKYSKYKIVDVLLADYSDIRKVYVPLDVAEDVPNFLENVFKYGQNDFQDDEDFTSLSVGDIIKIKGDVNWESTYWMIDNIGFKAVAKEDWDKIEQAPPRHPNLKKISNSLDF
jgi:hypothetical protein